VDALEQAAALVLVVEDHDDTAEMYEEYLQHRGYRVAVAHDGVEGVARAQTARPDLIVMDLMLPFFDGLAAARHLRANPMTRDIPILAITGVHDTERAQIIRAGCVDLLIKPCLPHELADAVARCLGAVRAASRATSRVISD
jgi:CheY-like chemotaxis protein